MFVMDVPPDVPHQFALVVIAQASQAKESVKTDRTLGVCALVQNPIETYTDGTYTNGFPNEWYSAVNGVGPESVVANYLLGSENQQFDIKSAGISTLKKPQHGTLELDSRGVRYYIPKPNYFGPDRATFLVETGGRKIKVEYFIKVMETVPGGTEGYDPYWDKTLCPNGPDWIKS